MDEISLLIAFPVALLIGGFIGYLLTHFRNKAKLNTLQERNSQLMLQSENFKAQIQQQLTDLKEQAREAKISAEKQFSDVCKERESIREEKDFLRTELTRRNSEYQNLQQRNEEQKAEVAQLQEKFTKEFENLANRIFEQKSEKFTLQNKENLQNILNPLQEKILNFEKKVEDTHKDNIGRNSQLQEQIRGLKELNEQMSREATNLTKALKGDSKIQGNWGELVLERVLEKSGLEKNREYFVQTSFLTENGKRAIPDVVIHLPGDKKMIIDSKVSLNAYERFVNDEEETNRPNHLKQHINSLKHHIEGLSAKNYHQLYQIESPDFVLMFVPIEPAFAVAINSDNGLYNWAFEKNIVIVTPTTLLATLRTIDSMWHSEKQQQNAIDIANLAGSLYDSFTSLTEELSKLGRQMGTVKKTFDGAMRKLTGRSNLITKVEKLKKMGASASKQIDQRLVSKAELGNEENEITDGELGDGRLPQGEIEELKDALREVEDPGGAEIQTNTDAKEI